MFLLLKIWICWCSISVAAGWIFSVFGGLNRWSYGLLCIGFAIATIVSCKTSLTQVTSNLRTKLPAWARRFKRPLPLLFAVTVVLSFLGGILYIPVYGDALSYRLPRLFHWIAEGRWHWIHTGDPRMNVVGPDTEWLWAPIWALTRNEKWCFLISFIGYLFLPAVTFSYYRRIGISRRVAWVWMWLLPTGYCYAFQASSIASDGYCATFALASVLLALRARERRNASDLLCSLLSISLITGVKQTNLLLVALWAIPLVKSIPRVRIPKAALAACVVIAALISFIPISYLNQKYTGNWKGFATGTNTRFDQSKLEPDSVIWGIAGNTFALTAQNLLPPYFPWMDRWDLAMVRLVASPQGKHFRSFERFGFLLRAPAEHNAGLGLGLCVLLIVSIFAAFRYRTVQSAGLTLENRFLILVPWLLLLIFMAKISVFQNARYLAPYYPFLLTIMLRQRGQSLLVRKQWWRWSAATVAILAVLMIIVSRQRPLWPGNLIARIFELRPSGAAFAKRVRNAFAFSDESPRTSNWLRQVLPPSEGIVGYAVEIGYSEPAIWHTPTVTNVWRFLPGDKSESLRDRGINYLLMEPAFRNDEQGKQNLTDLLAQGSEIISKSDVHFGPESVPEELWLMRLRWK
jgi:hypothetical protein